ncbi:nucleotide exchange factor GrpE [Candidatus Woesearchaeota archaeon]|nr:nucleotide exchange factor GrpE [Candidatus Woesearchaeota archaeon]
MGKERNDKRAEKVDVATLQKERDEARKEHKDLIDQLQRLQAEFENFIKRTDRELSQKLLLANRDLLIKLLVIYDDLHKAAENSGEEGVKLVYQELKNLLTSEGVHPIEALGKPFNPHVHEVLMTVPDNEQAPGTIVEEFQRGYLLHDKVLRCTKVKITKREE